MTGDAVLASDPVFQLNVLLWALRDLPEMTAIHPVLRRAGYRLESLGRRLLVPAGESAAAALRSLAGSADRSPCRPDLCLENADHPVTLVLELKSHGFSADSSNVRQAVKLIVASHDLAESFADTQDRPGHVVYGTVENDATGLAATLRSLRASVESQGVPAAPTGTIGISVDTQGAALSTPHPLDLPQPAGEALHEPALVLDRCDDDDIRPLYVIPWIPGIQQTQDSELQSDGYRELTARIIVEALAMAGQAVLPTSLEINGETLLGRATYGVFNRWLDTDRKHFAAAAIGVVHNAVKSLGGVQKRGNHLSIELTDEDARDRLLNILEQAKPDDARTNLEAAISAPPTLFDDPE